MMDEVQISSINQIDPIGSHDSGGTLEQLSIKLLTWNTTQSITNRVVVQLLQCIPTRIDSDNVKVSPTLIIQALNYNTWPA